jgi:hypothetical protein
MRFTAGPMSGMARVEMRFIDHVEAGGSESSRELRGDLILDAHGLVRHGRGIAPITVAGQSVRG